MQLTPLKENQFYLHFAKEETEVQRLTSLSRSPELLNADGGLVKGRVPETE